MAKKYLKLFAFIVMGLATLKTQAQSSDVRIPLKTFVKPAFDLIDNDGKSLSTADLEAWFGRKYDLSNINPTENKFWQNTEISKNKAVDQELHALMPAPSSEVLFDSFVGTVREIGLYAINVKNPRDGMGYRLKSGLEVHASLLRASLLRKIGYFQESPKYINSIRVKFKSLDELNSFIKQAFCVSGPSEAAIGCVSLDPEKRGFLSSKDEKNFTVVIHGSYLEKLNPEVPHLFDGLTPATPNTLSYFSQFRAFRALIAAYAIADAKESVNRYSAQAVSVAVGFAIIKNVFPSDFSSTSYDDVRWLLRKVAELTDKDWDEIVEAASYPTQLKPLVKAKMLHRFNNMIETFFEPEEKQQLVRVSIPSLKINSSDGIIVDGKVMTEEIAGYPQRFSHGERKSPFESGDFIKFLKIRAQSLAVETALSRLSAKMQMMEQKSQKIVGIEMGPTGIRPLVDAEYMTSGINAVANRIVTTGTFYGSQAAVQLVDSVSISANMGYFHILEGLDGIDKMLGGGVSLIRNFSHVTPIASMDEADKVPLRKMFVPSQLEKLTAPLKDGKLGEFLNAMKVGEVFTITDSVGLSSQMGYSTTLDAIAALSKLRPSVGLSVDGNGVILRQIQFVKTNSGLQVYIRDQNRKAFGLEFNTNYYINLLKIRSESTSMNQHTKVYLLNFNTDLISKVDNSEILPDESMQKKIEAMKVFGNKAALALRALLTESNADPLEENFKFQMFKVDHELRANDIRTKFLWFRTSQLKEEHLLRVKKPEVPTLINGVQVVNEPIEIVTYKKGRLEGTDRFGFGLEVGDAYLKEKFKDSAPSSMGQPSQNPSQMPFGKAQWTVIRTDTELTQNRPGALPSVAVIDQVWGGWSLKRSEMDSIFEQVREKTKGINFANYPLVPTGALAHVKKIDFFKITSHLTVLPEGLNKIKDLMLSTGVTLDPVKKHKFLSRLFQKLSENLGESAKPQDAELFRNITKIIGNGDQNMGYQKYLKQCTDNKRQQHEGGPSTYTYTWLNGTSYECMEPWIEKLIQLSRKFPEGNLRAQNKWMTNVLYVLEEQIPMSSIMNFLGPDKFLYYLEVTGFRSGDEDGDEGVYQSNIYGVPDKQHPYYNGLISVIAEKSKIGVTELNQSVGGY